MSLYRYLAPKIIYLWALDFGAWIDRPFAAVLVGRIGDDNGIKNVLVSTLLADERCIILVQKDGIATATFNTFLSDVRRDITYSTNYFDSSIVP